MMQLCDYLLICHPANWFGNNCFNDNVVESSSNNKIVKEEAVVVGIGKLIAYHSGKVCISFTDQCHPGDVPTSARWHINVTKYTFTIWTL